MASSQGHSSVAICIIMLLLQLKLTMHSNKFVFVCIV